MGSGKSPKLCKTEHFSSWTVPNAMAAGTVFLSHLSWRRYMDCTENPGAQDGATSLNVTPGQEAVSTWLCLQCPEQLFHLGREESWTTSTNGSEQLALTWLWVKFPGATSFCTQSKEQEEQVTHQATRQTDWPPSGSNAPWGCDTETANTFSPAGRNTWATVTWGLLQENRLPIMYAYKNDMVFLSIQLFYSFIQQIECLLWVICSRFSEYRNEHNRQ